jgi:hypothetical protein
MSPNSAALPSEAREASWRLLWMRLLAEPPPQPDLEIEPTVDAAEDEESSE